MRRLLLPLAALVITLAAAACQSSSQPGWTYAPPTEPPAETPAASGAPTGAPSSGAPASEAPASGAPGSEAPAGSIVELAASGIQWVQTELSAPADTAFVIRFDNQDQGVPHDVVIKDGGGMEMFRGDLVTGPNKVDYQVPALAAGTYTFVCSVHPNMVGSLKVGG